MLSVEKCTSTIMRLTDVIRAIVIVSLFCFVIIGVQMTNFIQGLKNNNSCDPASMMISEYLGMENNMDKCIQRQQERNYDITMRPFTENIGKTMSQIQTGITRSNKLHSRIKSVSNFGIKNFLSFGNIMNNMTYQGQIMISQIQDMFGKMSGVAVAIMYIMNTFSYTVASLRNSPFGRVLGLQTETCFHPDTELILQNGNTVAIKNIQPGDVLSKGNKVIAVLRIMGNDDDLSNPYFTIYSHKLKQHIYVTGSHYIEDDQRITQVKYFHSSVVDHKERTREMYCLVTDDHYIPIGEHMFLDWEY